MRNSFRLITSTVLGSVFLLSVGVGSTMVKGQIEKSDLSDAWCFQAASAALTRTSSQPKMNAR